MKYSVLENKDLEPGTGAVIPDEQKQLEQDSEAGSTRDHQSPESDRLDKVEHGK